MGPEVKNGSGMEGLSLQQLIISADVPLIPATHPVFPKPGLSLQLGEHKWLSGLRNDRLGRDKSGVLS